MNPAQLGATLGAVNVVVIALGVARALEGTHWHSDWFGTWSLVAACGLVPGVIVGALIGRIAERLRAHPRGIRVAVLVVPALLLVLALAALFDLLALAPLSCIPTVTAVLLLERWTRAPAPPPPVPLAARVR